MNKKKELVYKNVMFFIPVFVFVATFLIVKVVNDSYALRDWNSDTAPDQSSVIKDGTEYKMLAKNTYSWHLITHNGNHANSDNASGTKLIQSKDSNKKQAVVYCAEQGSKLSTSHKRTRYSIDSSNVSQKKSVKNNLKLVMPYMYPYINLGVDKNDHFNNKATLKSILVRDDLGIGRTEYESYKFDDLNVNEAITAVQAAIWNIIKNYPGHHQYRDTITKFEAFSDCSYYSKSPEGVEKVLTSEEQAWYGDNNSEICNDKSSNFYKYVFSHPHGDVVEKRINKLIEWYDKILLEKLQNQTTESEPKYFTLGSSNFTGSTLTVSFNTNISPYTIIFTGENNTELLNRTNTNDNTYTVSNIPSTVKTVNVEVISNDVSKNVYWYKAESGQDFIGLENSRYTVKNNLSLARNEEKANLIIYKVGNSSYNVNIETVSNATFDSSKCVGPAGCLSHAKFDLYYGSKTNLIRSFETDYSDTTDTSTFILKDLVPGKYYLKETQPSYGYDLYKFDVSPVDADGFIEFTLTDAETKAITVNNTNTEICVSKVDENDKTKILNGANFEIQDIDGMPIENFDTSDQEPSHCLRGQLQTGIYYLVEKKAPAGYSFTNTKYQFQVGSGNFENDLEDKGTIKKLTAVNNTLTITNKKGVVDISKTDATSGECVHDAKLTIKDSNGEIAHDAVTDELATWTSVCGEDDDGNIVDTHRVTLAPGTYTLTEDLAPTGYATGSTVTFTVDADGTVKEPVNMKDDPIEVCIAKTSKDSDKGLEGAEFAIYKEDGSLFDKFTSTSSPKCFKYMPVGTYTVKELKAPEGYKATNEDTIITVKDTGETQYFTIENELSAPKTAIDYSQTLIIIASIFMMFGLGMVGYYGYKKQN